ncbi:MAG: ORF6N domain-containing protein [Lachnospiraceae bacterium]|nr:ORF6N domain-containing protein [Lachnospiraceae bacterium]
MKNTTELLTVESIRNCVYTIRGQQVMLDSDLADIYGYEVKRLNEQVKRNINRFPEDFMFQIEPEELPERLKSQIATLNESGNKRGLHVKKIEKMAQSTVIIFTMAVSIAI